VNVKEGFMDEDSVVWDDSFSVGFEAIDHQHKGLVNMTNTLFEACRQGAAMADVTYLTTIRKAVEYARIHFADEEKYMGKANYPRLNEHKKEHEAFVAKIVETLNEFESGKTAPINMARFLKKWLLNHIAVSDKQYAPYLAKL
jgi:hemerythrin